LPSLISVQISNTVIPDSAAAYWAQPIVAADATTIRITGRYPDARNAARFARGGTRDEIRSFRERPGPAHDYSADISDKVQRGRKRCTRMGLVRRSADVRRMPM